MLKIRAKKERQIVETYEREGMAVKRDKCGQTCCCCFNNHRGTRCVLLFDALMPIIQIAACRLMCSTPQKAEPSEEDIQKNEESWQKYAAFRLRYFCCSTCCLFTIYFGVLIWLVVKDRG